MKIALEIREWY